MECPYKVLGVAKGCEDAQVKQAYKKLALKYHPDKFANASELEQKRATAKFQKVVEAFETLGDRVKRQKYDTQGHTAGGYGGRGNYHWGHAQQQHRYANRGPYSYKRSMGWTQFAHRNNLNGIFSSFLFSPIGKISSSEVFAMLGLVLVIGVGTSAMDDMFSSFWNYQNQGKLYKDLQSTTRKNKKNVNRRNINSTSNGSSGHS